jgi:hypothetical protein
MVPAGPPTCPAALKIHGATPEREGVICRVMQREHEEVDPTGMTAATYGYTAHEAEGGIFLTRKSDGSTVQRFCHGNAIPVLDDAEGHKRNSYTYCPIWQAEKARITGGRHTITNELQPEPVSMGVEDTLSSDDPWASARRDLDLLAS